MKSYTDLEQSRKLAEFLPIESADMRYHTISQYNLYPCDEIVYTIDFGKPSDIDTPAWSLSALLNVLSDITDYSFELVFLKRTTDGHGDVLENIYRCSVDMKDIWNTEPLDAIFEMIVWLKENRKI